MSTKPLLQVQDVRVDFAQGKGQVFQALKGVDLSVQGGQVTCLLGPNGAGKTTLMMTVAGILKPKAGSIRFEGEELVGKSSADIVARGLALVPENRLVFPALTVRENLQAGAFRRRDRNAIRDDIDRMFVRFPRLKERVDQMAGTLSGGEQQMLAVARILRTGAKLLLLDEISEGLAPVIVQALARMITALKAKGFTIIMVEQNFRFAAPLADRFYVMEHGQMVESFTSQELSSKMGMLNEYLGV